MATNTFGGGPFKRPPPLNRKFEDLKRKEELAQKETDQTEKAEKEAQRQANEARAAINRAEAQALEDAKAKPTLEQFDEAQKRTSTEWGVPEIKAAAKKKKEILLHTCFFQGDELKPKHCNCHVHVSFAEARNMINRGWAGFLIFKRGSNVQENRKVIVATRAFIEAKARSHDAFEHKEPLNIEGFLEYHMAPITAEVTSGLGKQIQNVRRREIAERKKEVSRHRHRVTPKGNSIDSDSSREDMAAGNGVGQLSSRHDRNTGKGLGPESNSNHFGESVGRKSLPIPIEEKIGREEAKEWRKDDKARETTIATGVEE